MSVVVVATITPRVGRSEEVEAVFAGAIPKVHDEPGCQLYALHRGRGGALVMIEKWTDADALKAHSQSATMAEVGAALADLVEGRSDIVRLDAAPFGDAAKGAL